MQQDTSRTPRIGILIVAFNAASTLAAVLDRIPKDFRPRITEVIVSDDSSTDATYLVGLGYQQVTDDLPLSVVRNPTNLGYGGNQKVGYRWAIEHDLDVVVLLHGDGQYAPELLPEMVAAVENGAADAVFGSRMLEPGAARKGGMPVYKYVGNRILTAVENKALGTSLSEFHSGYRAYRVASLRRLDFESYSDDFDFDTEIIIDMVDRRMRIEEIPIPTYYGDEICYVNGMRYARQVTQDVLAYRLRHGAPQLAAAELAEKPPEDVTVDAANDAYPFKWHPLTSHGRLLARAGTDEPLRILDLGCAAGHLSHRLRKIGHHVTGVDLHKVDGVDTRTDVFIAADLGVGLPAGAAGPFDLVVLGDILEHLRNPEALLTELHKVLAPRGAVLTTVPNFGHWYPRAKVAFGAFSYDKRGILDEDHVRFFTRRSIQQLFSAAGWRVIRREALGVPWELLLAEGGTTARVVRAIERPLLLAWEKMFAYQFLFELVPVNAHAPSVAAADTPAVGHRSERSPALDRVAEQA